MNARQDQEVQIRIGFTPKDIQVIESIVQFYGDRLDNTGILSHILNEYRLVVGEEDVE